MKIWPISVVVALICASSAAAFAAPMTNAQVKRAIIEESIAQYPGRCPCPYNVMRNGRACGGRSAYSRPGGYSPICYARDVTPAMIRDYRAQHQGDQEGSR
jgi:hypothetical protein